jgi:hypothetical protein
MMLERHLRDSHLMELPLTSKRRRSPVRRAACTILCDVGEEQMVTIQWHQASKSIHESTQVEICGVKGFPAIASWPLPSRIPYRYFDLESSYAATAGEPGLHSLDDRLHQWYCSSPCWWNFL